MRTSRLSARGHAMLVAGILWLLPRIASAQAVEEKSARDLVVLPIISHTPETRLALGAVSILFFRSPVSSRPSTLSAFFMYTQNEQILASLGSEVYTRDERHKLEANVAFIEFPDQFYGIGPDTPESNEEDYTPRSVNVGTGVNRQWRRHWHAGLRYDFSTWDVIKTEPDGVLAGGSVNGSQGGTVSGAGGLLNRDTRNNVYYTSEGSFCQIEATYYTNWLGSDFDYLNATLDLRSFLGIGSRQVVALQAVAVATGENTPFQSLAALGGSEIMRGYYQGRYRDRYGVVLQSEYRVKVWWRFGAVAFGSIGAVAPSPGDFQFDNVRYAAGGGIRFLVSRQEGMNLRLDAAAGENTSGFYITLGEAF